MMKGTPCSRRRHAPHKTFWQTHDLPAQAIPRSGFVLGRELEVGISVARLLLGLIVRLAECPVSSADFKRGNDRIGSR